MINVHIGPLPPTLNGISVYLNRLSKLEKKSIFVNWDDITSTKQFLNWSLRKIYDFKKKNLIYHPPSIIQRIILYTLSIISRHDFSLVLHGNPLFVQYNNSRLITRVIIRKMLKRANFVQVVNNQFKIIIQNYLNVKNANIIVKTAFLPPPLEDEQKILMTYEENLKFFFETKRPILISNASCLMFYNDNDLYGLDISIELIGRLIKDFPNIGFIFALANDQLNNDYLKKLKKRIEKLNIRDNIYFLTGQKELWPLFKRANIMLRPTCRDGYSVSVAEANYFGCSILASNVCKRPQGTVLFQNRDLDDFYNKCKNLIMQFEEI